MKRKFWTILLLVVFIVLVLMVILIKKENSFNSNEKDFGIDDVSRITSVSIKNDTGNIVLEKNVNHWSVNYQFKADEEAIDRLLNILQQLEIYAPVPRAGYEQRVNTITSSGKQIIIKEGEDLLSSFYMYEDTTLHPPTIMMKTEKNNPFIMKIPGYEASLSPFFTLSTGYWKENTLVEIPVTEINQIKVGVPEAKGLSFMIEKRENKYIVTSNGVDSIIGHPDPRKLTGYLISLKNISFTREITANNKHLLDSLNQATPYYTLEVTSENGKEQMIELFRIPTGETIDETGAKTYHDYHYLHVLFDEGNRLAKAKWVVFDPVLKDFKYFLPSKNT